jgi:hypothetical protein
LVRNPKYLTAIWNTILQTTQLSADPDYPADDSVDAAFSDLEGPHSNVDAFSFDPIVLIQAIVARLPTSTSGCFELPRDCGGEQLMTRWGRLVCHAVSLRLMTTRSSDRGRGGPSRHWCLYSRSATSRLRFGRLHTRTTMPANQGDERMRGQRLKCRPVPRLRTPCAGSE